MRKRFSIGGFSASIIAAAILAAGVVAPGASAHACTPGFYKNHLDVTAALITQGGHGSTLGSVFGASGSFASESLVDALQGGGGPGLTGALTILYRAATAAYLNGIAEPGWPGPSTVNLLAGVTSVVSTGDRDIILAYASELDADNNTGGCGPLGPAT
jgi:hypothetical protein